MPIRTLLTQPRFSLASLTRFHDALLRSPRRSESGNTAACLRSSPCVRSVNGTAVRAIVIAAAFFVTTIGLFAQAPPSADTFAWKLTPRVNYGALPILVVDANNTTYVRFDLSSIPSGSTVSKATLVLFVDAASGSGDVDAYDVESAWQESTLTSQNAPILGPSASGAQPTALTVASLNNFISIDVTTTVSAWLDGSLANNGLAVALVGSGGAFSFDSKESSLTSHQPQLIVQLAGSGVPGPQGPQGPTGSEGPAGPNGAAGPVGPIGPIGPAGPQGAAGPAGPAGNGFNYRGAWSSADTYAIDDTVTYNGSSYVTTAAVAANGNTPDQTPASWSLIAAAGATGPAGTQGLAGPMGSQGPAGPTGAAGPVGPIGPIGPAGPQGAAGPAGPAGNGFNYRAAWSSANTYAVNDTVTYNGSSYVATAAVAANGNTPDQTPASWSLIAAAGATGPAGPTGPQGPIGPQGPSGTATITLTSICSALTGSATSAALASLGCAVSSWPVGGTVSGYSSGTLILTYNGGSPLTITGNGAFSFGSEPTGSSYTVAIQTQPAGYACSVAGGATGTVSSSSASAVTVTCAALAPISFSGFEGVGGLASDGTYLWVSVEGTYNTQGQQITDSMLEKIDPNTGTVLASVPIGYQNGSVAFDGTNLWAIGHASASGSSGQVTLVNAATGNVTATYPVGTNPNSLAFDGTLMWICGGDGNVYALTSSGTIQYTVNLGTSSTAGQGLVRFDGARDIYVGEPQSGAIAKIDTTTGAENGLYTVTGPYGLTVAPVGSEDLWYPNSAGNLVELQAGGGDPTLFTSTYFVGDVTSDGVDVFTYSGTTVEVIDPSTTQTVNTYSGSAISYPDKVIYDGKSNVWVVNSNATIAKLPAVPGQ